MAKHRRLRHTMLMALHCESPTHRRGCRAQTTKTGAATLQQCTARRPTSAAWYLPYKLHEPTTAKHYTAQGQRPPTTGRIYWSALLCTAPTRHCNAPAQRPYMQLYCQQRLCREESSGKGLQHGSCTREGLQRSCNGGLQAVHCKRAGCRQAAASEPNPR